ncbi:uncharacterized protein LOC119484555 [Sebastes umbrosus]|uniref:uncharacterized protein LOC119484555 n=1 Tax=Sebastes umbrosus TaxID=72105 RepID=UPI00189CFAFD|nr:uncharacterized protein LOC119484555 [Sebastes umbrosus]
MQRYRWPGYEMQLLRELQRQQNNAQFCDTLLQTEGISVPTHSCILAALSPYLSQKLSATPSPPLGQKRELQLQAVKAQTLLKLVSLLYSGELEVKGSVEQNDVLSAARQFGITDLVEGQTNGGGKEGEPQKKNCFGSCREKAEASRERSESRVQVQAEMAGRRDTDSPVEKRSCVSTGPTPEPASSVAQSLDFSIFLQSQNITFDKHFSSTPCPHVSNVHRGARSDGESALDRSSDSVTNPMSTSTLSSNVMTFPISLSDDSNSPTSQEDGAYQQPSEFGDNIQVLAEEGTGLEDGETNGKPADNRENTEQPTHSCRDEMRGEENSTEKRHAHANLGIKSLAKMKQMQQMMETETAQISIKVKLRRRTKGEVWEVVSLQDADETLSVLTSLKQNGSNHKRPQTDLTNSEPHPSSVQPGPIHKPETQIVQHATAISPEPPPHPITPSASQLVSSDCFAPNQNDGLESVPLPQPPGTAEECDEQIEKLLEDIMMGLNILPNLERDCKKSHYLPPNHDGAPAICQVPVTENERQQSRMHAAVSPAGCVYYQDFGTQIGLSSTDTGVYCCFTAQNQPSCSSLSSVQPAAVLIQQQEQQHSSQYHSSVTPMGQRDGAIHQVMPPSKSKNCPYPEVPTTTSVIPTALFSSGQKLLTTLTYYPLCQEPSSQDSRNILEFLPLTNGNEAQSSHSLPCMDELQLPPCLSPLEPSTSAAKHQPALNNSTDQSDKMQPQPSLHRRPWLTVNPGSLQFPLSAITHKANESTSSPQDTNRSSSSKQWQKHLELNPQSGGARAASCTVNEVEDRGAVSAGHQDVAELESDPRKMKKSLKCRQGDTKGDAAAPKRRKRKRPGHPQEADSLFHTFKLVKVSDGTKRQINLSLCSVSLSSNNVLAREREMAASSSTPANKLVGKPNEPSTITESQGERTSGDLNTDQTQIRTRGFLKKPQEMPSNSILKPRAGRAQIVNKEGILKRGPGRPRKKKVEESPPESCPAVIDKQSRDVKSEAQIDSNLPKEGSEKPKRKRKKRIRNRSEAEAVPLKKTINAEEGNNNDVIPAGSKFGAPKRPQMVNLKEFQKLIKRQHSKTRKSKEANETNETARDVEREEGKACGGRCEELTKETEVDIAQPQNRDGIKESHALVYVTGDKNHNQIFNKPTAEYGKSQLHVRNISTSQETSLFCDESHDAVFSFDVLGEEGAKLAAETDQPRKNPDEAQKACDAGVPDTTQQTAINNEGSSHSDLHLPQEDKVPLDHNLNPERTSPPLSHTVGFSKSSGCDHEEEEEVEVDVLLYSPDKVPQTVECENGLDNMEITPEEEEEEDVNDIDVTGDEAE